MGLIIWGTSLSPASQARDTEAPLDLPVQLEKAADQANALSEGVYGGLDTTKDIIGKTEARNQAIETGRNAASQKMKELGDRARQAQESGEDILSETDQRVLKHISE